MIYDEISNIQRYKGISANLDKAIDFISTTDLKTLPLGRTEIDTDQVFVNVMMATGSEKELLKFEIHNKYLDIQIDIEGTEIIEIGLGELEELDPVDNQKDIGFYNVNESIPCRMGPGKFIICMTKEPHKPGIRVPGSSTIKKCVVKVAK